MKPMKLNDYPVEQIKATMALKDINATVMAKQLEVSPASIWKAIKGEGVINLDKLAGKIYNILQPELDVIHNAISHENRSFLSSDPIGPEVRMKMSATG